MTTFPTVTDLTTHPLTDPSAVQALGEAAERARERADALTVAARERADDAAGLAGDLAEATEDVADADGQVLAVLAGVTPPTDRGADLTHAHARRTEAREAMAAVWEDAERAAAVAGAADREAREATREAVTAAADAAEAEALAGALVTLADALGLTAGWGQGEGVTREAEAFSAVVCALAPVCQPSDRARAAAVAALTDPEAS